MKKNLKILFLGLLSSCSFISAAGAQGLIGEQHVEYRAGYSRMKTAGETFDGWGGGLVVNVPVVTEEQEEQYGLDFVAGGGYNRLTGAGLTIDGYGVGASVLGYIPHGQTFTPFAAAGLGWSRAEFKGPGGSATASGFDVPFAFGIELAAGPFSIAPFYSYVFELDDDIDDSWTIGAQTALWFNPKWGGTFTVAHSEADGARALSVVAGLIISF